MATRGFPWRAVMGGLAALGAGAAAAAEPNVAALSRAFSPEMATPAQEMTLAVVAKRRPFPEYQTWWPLGERFATFMAEAIVAEWSALPGHGSDLAPVRRLAAEYLETVYRHPPRAGFVEAFVARQWNPPLASGEFDALSFAFFFSAFDALARHRDPAGPPLEVARRQFAERVGRRFFDRLAGHLSLAVPERLEGELDFAQLKDALNRVLRFLKDEGYVRTHAAFRFDVRAQRASGPILQPERAFLEGLRTHGLAYGLYEMGYPAILPSAVYLFELVGEAQHHSSRTIAELFRRAGCEAREVEDFDPRGYPADLVVELWEIRRR